MLHNKSQLWFFLFNNVVLQQNSNINNLRIDLCRRKLHTFFRSQRPSLVFGGLEYRETKRSAKKVGEWYGQLAYGGS